jgi:FKBP-type peptidyl-prolyl cis-trans isomerase
MKKIYVLVIIAILVAVSCSAQPKPAENALSADASYAFGMAIAYNFKEIDIDLDYEAFVNGLKDVLQKDKPKFDMQQAEMIIQTAITAAMAKQSELALAKEKGFFDENAKKPGIITTASGLQYEVIKAGTGVKPNASDVVTVQYTGTFIDGQKFDSSYDHGEPAVFPLDQVIPGWTEGIQLMNVGGTYKLYIPSGLAYGPEGAQGFIGPNQTLIFEVELLETRSPLPGF